MTGALSAILQYGGDAAFFILAGVALAERRRRPERIPVAFVAALGLLGLTGLVDIVTNLTSSHYVVTLALSAVLFSASGYALVEFRSVFVPLRPGGRRFLLVVEGIALVLAVYTGLAVPARTGITGINAAAALGLIGTWIGCVADSIFRLWRASRPRPAVQRARLRALCLGYGLIVSFVVVNVVGTGLISGSLVPVAVAILLDVLIILAAPLLYLSFAPPAWLRRLWRASEEERFSSATRELLLFSPNPETLARRSLEWANRLVGADMGFIANWEGDILGTAGMTVAEAREVESRLGQAGGPRIVPLGAGLLRNAIVVPLSFEAGTGRVVVVAGPFTPVFGEDEIARLMVYSVAVTAAIDRTRLVEAIQTVNADLERRVSERTAALWQTNAELATRNEDLRNLDLQRRDLMQRLVSAHEEERRRIARDIHDDAVQVMTAVNMRVLLLQDRLGDARDREMAGTLAAAVSEAIGRLRHVLFELSPPAIEERGLAEALRLRLDELGAENSFQWEMTGDPDDQLDGVTRLQAYRIAQEALVNASKHAGAQTVQIELGAVDGGVLVRVIDDGHGFDPGAAPVDRPGHLGLLGMRERAEMAGGWWRLESSPGKGTIVEFWVPGEAAPGQFGSPPGAAVKGGRRPPRNRGRRGAAA